VWSGSHDPFFKSAFASQPNKVSLKCPSARPYVRPSTKKFLKAGAGFLVIFVLVFWVTWLWSWQYIGFDRKSHMGLIFSCLLYSLAHTEPLQVDRFWRPVCHTRKEVPFGGRIHTAVNFGVKSQKTNSLGVWIGIVKCNMQNIKTCMLSKLLHRFQPNLRSDTEHQLILLFVGGLNTCTTNPKGRTAAIVKMRKIDYLSDCLTNR